MGLSGRFFTWNNSSEGAARIECRLDRTLVNASFLHSSMGYNGQLLNPSISDHCAILISKDDETRVKSPFRFFNAWAKVKDFFRIVKEEWSTDISRTPIFRVVKKLGCVKKALVTWQRTKKPILVRVVEAKNILNGIQTSLAADGEN